MSVEETRAINDRLLRVETAVAQLGWQLFTVGGTRQVRVSGKLELAELMEELERRLRASIPPPPGPDREGSV
jgi:hypothetical protein